MKENKPVSIHRQEDLLARIEIQDTFIRHFENEIYDNVNQVLCLARIKLEGLDPADKKRSAETLSQSVNLIAKAINDLRNLAKQVKKM